MNTLTASFKHKQLSRGWKIIKTNDMKQKWTVNKHKLKRRTVPR